MSNEYKDYYKDIERTNDDISSCLECGGAIVSLEELEFFLPEMIKREVGELRISQIGEEYFMIDKRWQLVKVKKIVCDLCKQDIEKERNVWYIQIPFYQKDGAYVNGKLVGEFGSFLDYKIIEICPTCAGNFARNVEKQMKELGIEI